jgi:hypothetical protein
LMWVAAFIAKAPRRWNVTPEAGIGRPSKSNPQSLVLLLLDRRVTRIEYAAEHSRSHFPSDSFSPDKFYIPAFLKYGRRQFLCP